MATTRATTRIRTGLLAGMAAIALAAGMPTGKAQNGEAAFLDTFEGEFSGRGTLQRGVEGGGRSINCNVSGTRPDSNAITIEGSCGVFVFRSGVSAQIRYDPASGSYTGLWQDRNSTSDLSGSRSGDTLTLQIQRRGGAAASGASGRMVVRAAGPNQYQLTVSTTGEAERPQRVDVTLNRS